VILLVRRNGHDLEGVNKSIDFKNSFHAAETFLDQLKSILNRY
jgi:hypothetical protein